METGGVMWGKALWWLAVNGLAVALSFAMDPAIGIFCLVVSGIVWLVLWRRTLNLAERVATQGATAVLTDIPPMPAAPAAWPKKTIAVLSTLAIAFGAKYVASEMLASRSGPLAVRSASVAGAPTPLYGKVSVRYSAGCQLTPAELADPYWHFCLVFAVANNTTATVDTLGFNVILVPEGTTSKYLLHPIGRVEPYIFNTLALAPGGNTFVTVRGVTDESLKNRRPHVVIEDISTKEHRSDQWVVQSLR